MTNRFIKPSILDPVYIARRGIAVSLKDIARKYAKGKLIDLGCGAKPYYELFSPYCDSYFGVDYLNTAEANYGEETKADLWVDCTNTKLPERSFDTVLATQVLEHIEHPVKLLEESYRLLRYGGVLIMTVAFSWQEHSRPYDYYRFSQYALQSLLTEAGFTVLEMHRLEGAFASIQQMNIISLLGRKRELLLSRIYNKVVNQLILIPLINIITMVVDKRIHNDALYSNILAVARKE